MKTNLHEITRYVEQVSERHPELPVNTASQAPPGPFELVSEDKLTTATHQHTHRRPATASLAVCSRWAWEDNNSRNLQQPDDGLEERVFGRLPDAPWIYPGHGNDTTLDDLFQGVSGRRRSVSA
jgi:hypothetical protein